MSEVKGAAMELGTERIRKLLVQYAVTVHYKSNVTYFVRFQEFPHPYSLT